MKTECTVTCEIFENLSTKFHWSSAFVMTLHSSKSATTIVSASRTPRREKRCSCKSRRSTGFGMDPTLAPLMTPSLHSVPYTIPDNAILVLASITLCARDSPKTLMAGSEARGCFLPKPARGTSKERKFSNISSPTSAVALS